MLKALYVVAIGLLFAAFIGFGVNTFYPGPESPWKSREYVSTPAPNANGELTEADKIKQKQQQAEDKKYQEEHDLYSQNVSLIYLVLAVLIIAVSLFGLGKIAVIGDGITLGGVFVLFVGLVSSFEIDNAMYRFAGVTVGLAIILFLSYWKFVRPNQNPTL